MSASASENILARLLVTLLGAAIGASVERDRMVDFEREDLPGVVIKPKNEESQLLARSLLRCVLAVEIEVHTRGNVPSTLADPIAVAIHTAILADPQLNGVVAQAIRTGKEWEFSDSDGTGGKLTLTYQFHYAEPA